MKKKIFSSLLAITLALFVAGAVLAQSQELELSLSRDWGYGGFGGDIQGLFSMKVNGPEALSRVDFYIDQTKIGEDGEAPFRLQFKTDDYPLGQHILSARGFLADGTEYTSNVISATFVSASEGTDAALRIALPVGIVIVIAVLLSFVVPMLTTRGKRENLPLGVERNYGLRGGTICPKCHRPFAMHLWAINLGLARFDRCPYCGKWSVVRSQPLTALRQAEKSELDWVKGDEHLRDREEGLKKEVDESRYQDL